MDNDSTTGRALRAENAELRVRLAGIEDILGDPVWTSEASLTAMPFDSASARVFATLPDFGHDPGKLLGMAQDIHERYVRASPPIFRKICARGSSYLKPTGLPILTRPCRG